MGVVLTYFGWKASTMERGAVIMCREPTVPGNFYVELRKYLIYNGSTLIGILPVAYEGTIAQLIG